jgi:hypothetical protein
VVAIYSTFLQRAYDQLIHDVALQKLPVVFALDRAGLVGPDGPTHAGVFDIAFTRCIPHMSVACPADENECRQLLSTAYAQDHAVTVRYPRGAGVGVPVDSDLSELPLGQAQIRREGQGVAILAFGPLLYEALKAAESLNATVINMRWAKPLDLACLQQVVNSHERLVTIEDGARMGGAGSAVLEALQDLGIAKPVLVLGYEDAFTMDCPRPALSSALTNAGPKTVPVALRKRCSEWLSGLWGSTTERRRSICVSGLHLPQTPWTSPCMACAAAWQAAMKWRFCPPATGLKFTVQAIKSSGRKHWVGLPRRATPRSMSCMPTPTGSKVTHAHVILSEWPAVSTPWSLANPKYWVNSKTPCVRRQPRAPWAPP